MQTTYQPREIFARNAAGELVTAEDTLYPWQRHLLSKLDGGGTDPCIWWYDFGAAAVPAGKTVFAQHLYEHHNVLVERTTMGGTHWRRRLQLDASFEPLQGFGTAEYRGGCMWHAADGARPVRATQRRRPVRALVIDLPHAERMVSWASLSQAQTDWPTIVVLSNHGPNGHSQGLSKGQGLRLVPCLRLARGVCKQTRVSAVRVGNCLARVTFWGAPRDH